MPGLFKLGTVSVPLGTGAIRVELFSEVGPSWALWGAEQHLWPPPRSARGTPVVTTTDVP